MKMLFTITLIVWLKKTSIWQRTCDNLKDDEYFKYSTKCWICDNDYIERDVKVRDHFYITEFYRSSAHSNITVKLNNKISVVFHNLKNYDSHLIIQELGKFNF